ncbi:exopolysaccharide biosynthesis protein [Sinomonas sp. R1AF57]|nr:exopolysaccharide biosynthesis protein [Sinomonas sp. R1AF57]
MGGRMARIHPTGARSLDVTLGGTKVTLLDSSEAVESILGGCLERELPLGVVSANLDHVYHFGSGGRWERTLDAVEGLEWLTLLDGAPLASAAERITGQQWPRLAGSDLIGPLLDRAEADGLRVGFLGGLPEAHQLLRGRLAEQRPALRIAGFWGPSRGELEDPRMSRAVASRIADAGTDLLVVGLGKPRQELWIAEHGAETGARVLLAFGAVVDFLAERIRRAPVWVSDHGLEWAWRLALEPARLSERYLVQGPEAYLRLRRNSAPGTVALTAAARAAAARDASRAAHPAGRGLEPGSPRPRPNGGFIPVDEPADVAALIVAYSSADALGPLIDSLRGAARSVRLRVVVADNSPDPSTLEALAAHPDVVAFGTGGNLGYAGGINAAMAAAGQAEGYLVLNPDTMVLPGAVDAMLARLRAGAGAVVPLMLTDDGERYPSLRREPTAARAWGDALFGARFPGRPQWCAETDFHDESYAHAHTVDWATGAAILVSADAAAAAGPWDERYFMYSEETDYCRTLRQLGYEVWFEPAARVRHAGAGSGSSGELAALMAVNKVRYLRKHATPARAALGAGGVVVREVLRAGDAGHRRTLATLLAPWTWGTLPHATRPAEGATGDGAAHPEGCVIIPAHNEEAVIGRTLGGLRPALESGAVEVIVACNGCTDRTAAIAADVPGVRVLDLVAPGKTNALNAADAVATRWPRVYLDADIEIPPAALRSVLAELGRGRYLAGRPDFRYDTSGCGALVGAYYRARVRVPPTREALWGAGCYAMTEAGHDRLGAFPDGAPDDFYVDTLFSAEQKVLLDCEPVVVRPPRTAGSLLSTLHRVYRAPAESGQRATPARTLGGLVASVRGPLSLVDAAVYASFALMGRRQSASARGVSRWERDESSRR